MTARAITALYDDYDTAARAVDRLEAEGIPHTDISIVSRRGEDTHADEPAAPHAPASPGSGSTTADGAGTGASLGTLLGGGAGLLAGLGLLAIPGVGPVVAAGWLVATVTGAGVGAAAGGLIGGLTGAGLSPDEAETYAEGVRRGGTLVTVRASEETADRAMAILDAGGSIDLDERAAGWRAQGWTGASPAGGEPVGTAAASADDGRRAGEPPAPSQTFGSTTR